MLRFQMIPISGGRIQLYQKGEDNVYSTLSKSNYIRPIPRNTAAADSFSYNQRVQLAVERSFEESNNAVSLWFNREHLGDFNGKTFIYRNIDIILPVVCIIAAGLSIYFL